jgi:hypothetical protein
MKTRSSAVVVDAVNVILRGLARMPDAPEVHELRAKALACMRKASEPKAHAPTIDNDEALMKKVLDLHLEARRLAG